MSNDIAIVKESEKTFLMVPSSLGQAMELAKMIADSDLAPKDYKGKPGNVFIAMQMGAEINLAPMQALQNIAVINGRPCVWGDAALGLVRSSPVFEGIREWIDGDIKDGDAIAYCEVKRRGEPAAIREFGINDAKQAGLWNKQGPWQQYPKRMLQMRARGFALRDMFTDVLKGLNISEEIIDLPKEDYSVEINPPTKSKGVEGLKARLSAMKKDAPIEQEPEQQPAEEAIGLTFHEVIEAIESAQDIKQLVESADLARSLPEEEKKLAREVYKACEKKINGGVNHE